jgi:hypothetical protein
VPTFHDGGRTWRVRFAPPRAGEWRRTILLVRQKDPVDTLLLTISRTAATGVTSAGMVMPGVGLPGAETVVAGSRLRSSDG